MDVNVSGIADGAEKAVEAIMKVEPMIATGIGMFVPGAAPIVAMVQPWVVLAAPYLEQALKDISAGNGGDALGAMLQLLQHVSKGQPNSPMLGVAQTNTAQQQDGLDASRVGSG